jgi:hypothetical protein
MNREKQPHATPGEKPRGDGPIGLVREERTHRSRVDAIKKKTNPEQVRKSQAILS